MATSYVINSSVGDKHKKLSKSFSTPASQMSAILKVNQRPPLNRSLTRTESIKQSITSGTANFFGIPGSSDHHYSMQKWENRRMRHCSRRYGPIKENPTNEFPMDYPDGYSPVVQTPVLPEAHQNGENAESGISADGQSLSIGLPTKRRNTLTRRESVVKMAWDGLASYVKSPARKRQPAFRLSKLSRSFSPSVVVAASAESVSVFEPDLRGVSPNSSEPVSPQTDFPPSATAINNNMTVIPEEMPDGGALFRDTETRPRRSSMKQATKPQHLMLRRTTAQAPPVDIIPEASPLNDDVFFDITPMSSVPQTGALPTQAWPLAPPMPASNVQFALHYPPRIHDYERSVSQESTIINRNLEAKRKFFGVDQFATGRDQQQFQFDKDPPSAKRMPPADRTGQGKFTQGLVLNERLSLNNIWSRILDHALKNSNRRVLGEGVVGRFFGRTLKKPSELSPNIREKLDDIDDYRPFFTYWVTSVQILVLIISLALYGFGPFGFGRSQYTAMVLQTSLVLEQVAYFEQENFWLGPRFADLVHLGAKYSPCMRRDKNIFEVIDQLKETENGSACCIRNDRTGCYQTTQEQCPSLLAVWHKWNGVNNPEHRVSGSVCNQDPRECKKPASAGPFKWPDDITKWPICKETSSNPRELHTKCEITGRPCCFGIVGECRVTTREYCDFVRGYFHEEATLCSQVSCLGEVCGMIPFVSPEYPNQFYRLFISIFLHAGIIHVIFTLLVQFIFMRDLEKLIGWFRLSIIYLGSGVGGNLASAVFVPYETEVGPAGCHFGLLAALFVDAFFSWRWIVKPWKALMQLGLVLIFLLILGLLPWVDNWAQTFGFVFGLLLSFALFPYIQADEHDRHKRIIVVVTSLLVSIGLFAVLLILFYFIPLWECKNCVYFNCIPFTAHFCDNKGISLVPLPY